MDNPRGLRTVEQAHRPSEETLTFRRSTFFAALLPITFVLGLAAGYVFWGLPAKATEPPRAEIQVPSVPTAMTEPTMTAAPTAAATQTAAPTATLAQQAQATQSKPTRYDVSVDDDPALGPADAPIVLIEFSDYECPYCRKWHNEVWPQIQADFKDKVRFVYRDFPLDGLHANAVTAAETANCANEQGKYWEYHNLLFSGATLGQATYEKFATDLKLDLAKFKECVSSRRYKDEVQNDYNFAAGLGIRSTPTFFINGLAVVGAQPYEVFKQVIQKELAGEIPK